MKKKKIDISIPHQLSLLLVADVVAYEPVSGVMSSHVILVLSGDFPIRPIVYQSNGLCTSQRCFKNQAKNNNNYQLLNRGCFHDTNKKFLI